MAPAPPPVPPSQAASDTRVQHWQETAGLLTRQGRFEEAERFLREGLRLTDDHQLRAA